MINSAIRNYESGYSSHNREVYKAICAENGIPDGYNEDSHIWVIKSSKSPNLPKVPPASNMDSLSRSEVDAKLEATEARIETRIVSIEHSLAAIAKGQEEAIASGKSTRQVIIATGVAVVLGIAAFNATVLSNMVASFESGKNTSALLSSAEKSITEATRALEAAAAKAASETAQTPAAPPAK